MHMTHLAVYLLQVLIRNGHVSRGLPSGPALHAGLRLISATSITVGDCSHMTSFSAIACTLSCPTCTILSIDILCTSLPNPLCDRCGIILSQRTSSMTTRT